MIYECLEEYNQHVLNFPLAILKQVLHLHH